MHVVEPVLPAPVAVDLLGVVQSIPGAAAHVWYKYGEAVQREELDQRHREPGEIGALLALRPAMDVINQRARALVTQRGSWQVQARGNARAIERNKRGILARRKLAGGNPQHALVRMGD